MNKFCTMVLMIILFSSCDKDDSQELMIQNATIFIDESETDNCLFTIRTENNESYSTEDLPGDYSAPTFEARITYRTTEERMDCGFAGSLIKIEILQLEKI